MQQRKQLRPIILGVQLLLSLNRRMQTLKMLQVWIRAKLPQHPQLTRQRRQRLQHKQQRKQLRSKIQAQD